MKNNVILSNTLVLTREKENNLSKERNICREGSAESFPTYTSWWIWKSSIRQSLFEYSSFSVGCGGRVVSVDAQECRKPYPEPLNLTALFLRHFQKVAEVRLIKQEIHCNPSSRCLHNFSKDIHICKHIHNDGNDLNKTEKTQIIVLWKHIYKTSPWSFHWAANTNIFHTSKNSNVLHVVPLNLECFSRPLDLLFEKSDDCLCDICHKYQSLAKRCVMGVCSDWFYEEKEIQWKRSEGETAIWIQWKKLNHIKIYQNLYQELYQNVTAMCIKK